MELSVVEGVRRRLGQRVGHGGESLVDPATSPQLCRRPCDLDRGRLIALVRVVGLSCQRRTAEVDSGFRILPLDEPCEQFEVIHGHEITLARPAVDGERRGIAGVAASVGVAVVTPGEFESPPSGQRGRPEPGGERKAAAFQLAGRMAVVVVEEISRQLALHEQCVADRGGVGLVQRQAQLSTADVERPTCLHRQT